MNPAQALSLEAGPVPADAYTLETLREAQTLLDAIPGCEAKGRLRLKLDSLQRWHGGLDEWGRRADGSRPSDERPAAVAAKIVRDYEP